MALEKRFTLHISNRMERLVADLAAVLNEPPPSPFSPEIIVVQSKGMERWLLQELSRRLGIAANMQFPFPNAFADRIFDTVAADADAPNLFQREILTWAVYQAWPDIMKHPDFNVFGRSSEDRTFSLWRCQMARRMADLYDQYCIFRPDWILAWDSGERDDGWQTALWRGLFPNAKSRHKAALGQRVIDRLIKAPPPAGLPERVSVFGISTLPQFHMALFEALSHVSDVHLFLMNPCRDYWGDAASPREEGKRRVAAAIPERPDLLPDETTHPLLGSMGALGRDFFDLVAEIHSDLRERFDDSCDDMGEATLLTTMQSDILNNRKRPSDAAPRKRVANSDASIRVHVCHSPMREVEVLSDHLLSLFDELPDLMPGDILVMTPDIERYAPYIQAVFDAPRSNAQRIPFSIADRSIMTRSPVMDTFLTLLEFPESRCTASEVLAVLESPPVRNRFGLDDTDLDRIRRWIANVRIFWGMDGGHRERLGLPGMTENTWQAGIDRLLLGYAMSGEHRLFADILPYGAVEGGETAVLGRFLSFLDRLFTHVRSLPSPRPLSRWAEDLRELIRVLFLEDAATADDLNALCEVLHTMAADAEIAGCTDPVSLDAIRHHLSFTLQQTLSSRGYLSGGVTFCALLPMRSVPFRIICLLGMDIDAFPRNPEPAGFDLMAADPRRGDRSRRKDDRYLFLEALISARERLCISYVGRSVQDNAAIPPSVVVSDLMDVVSEGFFIDNGDILEDRLVTVHRLQGFHPDYFIPENTGGRLQSYSDLYLETADRLRQPDRSSPVFFNSPLPAPETEWSQITLDDWCAFWRHPARFLLNRRLEIFLEDRSDVLTDTESFKLEGLDAYWLKQDLLEDCLAGRSLKRFYPLQRQAGALPHGRPGECDFHDCRREVERFAEVVQPLLADVPPPPMEIEMSADGVAISGPIRNQGAGHLLHYRMATLKPKDFLTAWLRHLLVAAFLGPERAPETVLVGADGRWQLMPPENPMAILESLTPCYKLGLTTPLPFFMKSSWAYADHLFKQPDDHAVALAKARSAWSDTHRPWNGEDQDPYFRKCFSIDPPPFDDRFHELAMAVFEPLMAHREAM